MSALLVGLDLTVRSPLVLRMVANHVAAMVNPRRLVIDAFVDATKDGQEQHATGHRVLQVRLDVSSATG